MKNLSPIVLFVYNRPWHTQQTIEALQKNELAIESNLIIYSDEANNKNVQENVDKVRLYIDQIDKFKKVTIIKRETNWGLANNIIDGVTKVVNQYGKIIVLEDDLITSPYFLKYMNEALEVYKDEKKVWHISGWNYPIDSDNLRDVFLWRLMNCWGWATWKDRWKYYEKDVDKTISEFNKEDIKRFNLDVNAEFFLQIIANKEKKVNTWSIFWYATIFKKNGLCLSPSQTFVQNIGHDGSGVHSDVNDIFVSKISLNKDIDFVLNIDENKIALEKVQNFLTSQKKSFLVRVFNKLARMTTGKNIIK